MSYTLYRDITKVNRTVMTNKQNKYIVIHYTGNQTDSAKANANYFRSIKRGASAHYFVDKTTVYQVVKDKDAAWAVGKNYGKNNLFNVVKNTNSISIEMCSNNGAIAEETFQNTVELTKTLMKKYNIPASNVYRHLDVASKRCPGWPGWYEANPVHWNRFKAAISSSTPASQPATPKPSASTSTANSLIKLGQQHAVNFTGHKITLDGLSGPETNKMKARVLQRAINLDYNKRLVEDGAFGTKSNNALGSHYVKQGEKQYMVTAAEILMYLNGINPNGVELPGTYGSGLVKAAVKKFGGNGKKITAAQFKKLIS